MKVNTNNSVHMDREDIEALLALLRGETPKVSQEKVNRLRKWIEDMITHTPQNGVYHLYLADIAGSGL